MKRTIVLGLILVLVSLTASILITNRPSVKASSLTVVVPDDYPTIAAALQHALSGTIFVKNGTYQEHSLVINNPISLIGEDPNSTIINDTDPLFLSNDFPPVNSATIQIGANDVKVSGFTLMGGANGVAGTGDRIQIMNNTIIAPYGCINLAGSFQTIAQNNIQSPNLSTGTSGGGIQIKGSHNNITSNVLSGSGYGILLKDESSYNLIYDTTITGLGGIELNGNGNTVAKNNLNGLFASVTIDKGSNNFIWGNKLVNGGGIAVTIGYNNTIYSNSVTNCRVGAMVGGSQTEFSYQTSGPWTGNNTLYHNNFINNTSQVWTGYIVYGNNFFDNGKEGNYWSDYTGTDSNDDGLGDKPYIIDANRSDRYPLMLPFNIDNNTITPPSPTPTLNPNASPTPSPSTPQPTPSSSATPANNVTLQVNTYWIAVTAVAIVVVLTVSAMLFVKRSKKQNPAKASPG